MKKLILFHFFNISQKASVVSKSFYLLCIALLLTQAGMAQVDAGQAVALNGINQYCTMAQATDVTGEFTVEAWVRPDATSNRVMSIFSSRYGAEFSFDMKLGFNTTGNSTIQADIGNGSAWLNTSASTTYKIERLRWYHIAYTVSGSTNKYIIYINGRQVASGTITSGPSTPVLFNSNHQNANIGQNQTSGDEFFLGLMDEVRIYSRALSATEMLDEAIGNMSATNRVKYFSFENATGNHFTSLWNGNDILVYQGSSIFTSKSYALTLCQVNDATAITNTSFIANWIAPVLGKVTNYLVDVATEPTFSTQVVTGKSVDASSTSVAIGDLMPNKQYYYRVRANNTDAAVNDQGAYSNTVTFTTLGVPTISFFTPSSQSYGGTVVITGTNFTPSSGVKFGGTDALSVVYNSATSLTATIGKGSSGALTVTTLGGTATATNTFTFLPPSISSFTPASGGYGNTITITGNNFLPSATVQFGGTPALSVVYNSATSLTATVGSGSSGALTVTTLGGTATATSSFTFLPLSISSFTPISGGYGNIITITGNNFLPSATVQFGGTPALSVTYNSPTSLTATISNGSSGPVTVTTPGGSATSSVNFTYLPLIFLVDSAKTNNSTASSVITVNATAWANACGNLQTALTAAAVNGGQVWVKKGTYYPTAYPVGTTGGSSNKDFAFALANKVTVYGGFAGTETDTAARTTLNKTILSGDIGTKGLNSDNCYHVLFSNGNDNTARIDGLTITDGNAIGPSFIYPSAIAQNAGGGMVIVASSPTITNCVFTGNIATLGCGLYNRSNASPNITNSIFSSNISTASNGAGMYNDGSSPYISKCVFTNNSANNGGAIYNTSSSPIIYSSVFYTNTATNLGGSIVNNNSSPQFSNCVFTTNSAMKGGAAQNISSNARFLNCTFSGNTASSYGGCMTNTSSSNTQSINSIVWGNTSVAGSGIYDIDNSSGTTTVIYSCIQGGFSGQNNISTNPLFVNAAAPAGIDGVFGTADDGLNIRIISPVRNIGINGATYSYGVPGDITGANRIQQFNVDLGAYEGGVCQAFSRLYVDSAMAIPGNGSTWATAVTTLQQAIDIASNCGDGITTQIWVKKGTYYPAIYPPYDYSAAPTPTASDYTFLLKNNLAIYGGFAGTETDTSQRVAGNTTILNGTNCYHVLLSNENNNTARIDRFTITGGNAKVYGTLLQSSIFKNNGGGMYLNASSPTITNCTFVNDSALYGGGIYAEHQSNPIIYNCSFIGNIAQSGSGIYNFDASSPQISNSIFSNNTGKDGCGIFNTDSSSPKITNCVFSANTGTGYGGGINNTNNSSPVLNGCVFSGNKANYGGAVNSLLSSTLSINNCTFSDNSASNGGAISNISDGLMSVANCTFLRDTASSVGGAIYKDNLGTLNITRSRFDYNRAQSGGAILSNSGSCTTDACYFNANTATAGLGGGIYASYSNTTHTNCVFYANTAQYGGGGMYNTGNFSTINCTFYANVVNSGLGGAISMSQLLSPIVNSIFWGNVSSSGGQISSYLQNSNIKYNLLEDGYVNTGNISADPRFVNKALPAGADGIFGTVDDGLRLQLGSPAIDAGSSESVPTGVVTDAYGATRIQGAKVDMGAYESFYTACDSLGVNTLFVNNAITTSGNGSSWATSFKTLQAALLFAATCSNIIEIRVAGGTYYPAGSAANNAVYRDSAFSIPRTGLKIYGGYNASTGLRDISANPTILDGAGASYHVVLAVNLPVTVDSLVLDGFTLQGGKADGANTKLYNGQAIRQNEGAAIQFYNHPGNTKIMVRNCIFKNNIASVQGAGFYNLTASPSINGCSILDNTAPIGAGMFSYDHCTPIISNTIIAGNVSTGSGAGIYNSNYCSPSITNCTFSANTGANGAVVYNTNNSIPTINNSIVWGNTSSNGVYLVSGANPITISSSLVQSSGGSSNWNVTGFTNGGGNIDANPMFIAAATAGNSSSGNYRLLPCSPAIDSGGNALIIGNTDRDGNARIYNVGKVDMGAYEFAGNKLSNADMLAANGDVATVGIVAAQSNMLMATSSACRAVANILPDNTATQVSGNVNAQVWVDAVVAHNPVNGFPYVQRHYDINPANNAATATAFVTLYFTQAEFDAFNADSKTGGATLPTGTNDAAGKARLRIFQYHGSSNGSTGLPASYTGTRTTIDPVDVNIIWNNNLSRWEIGFSVTGFSGFFAGVDALNVLPVTLLSFSANLAANKTVGLRWNVAEQVGIKNYIVERSVDGNNFSKIDSIAANYLTTTSYALNDASLPSASAVYYRLMIVGIDGTVTYSQIVTIRLGESNLISIYPNPAKNFVWLTGGSAGLIGSDAFVTDMQGRVISKVRISQWPMQINISNFAAGLLTIRMVDNQILKLVIER